MQSTTVGHSQVAATPAPLWQSAQRAGWFILCLATGLAIFVFSVDYHTQFWTNTSGAYKVVLTLSLLFLTLILRGGVLGRRLRPIAMAFFAASLTNVVTWYWAEPLQRQLLGLAGVTGDSPQGLALGKLADVVLRLGPILTVVLLAGDDLKSLFLRKGQLRWSLSLGALALANLTATALAVAATAGTDLTVVFTSLPWWVLYSLLNAVMEEVWFRGLFLERLAPLIGAAGALWVTSLLFGISHLFAAYLEPGAAPVFGTIVLTLGLAFGLLMQRTKTIWGAVLYHTAADVFWFVAFGF